ncbi:MAG: hypothetical protein COB36_09410 [Alphaproteobacteria bacterium]|nr:MAG: hypothetical protein COB36_09410 [Alphaproteobacteria bacterium]
MTDTISFQRCNDCKQPQYPLRELCGQCLSPDIRAVTEEASGALLSWTRLHVTMEPYFQERLPSLVGEVLLDNGLMIMVHLDMGLSEETPQAGMRLSLTERPALDDRLAYFAVPEPKGN